jgi:hypothetical protein
MQRVLSKERKGSGGKITNDEVLVLQTVLNAFSHSKASSCLLQMKA